MPEPAHVPSVCVVVTCHNLARFLPAAVASVVAQTRTDWELVIVNDGSTDDTSAVAARLVAEYPRRSIRVVEQARGGVSHARNTGFENARAPYILPLDADDELDPRMIECTAPVLDTEPGVAVVYTDFVTFGAQAHTQETIVTLPEYDFGQLCAQNLIGYCSLLRRTAWEAVGGYDTGLRGHEDWDLWIGIGALGLGIRHVRQPLFRYRVRDDGLGTRALQHDLRLRARIVSRRPEVFNAVTVAWARAVLERRGEDAAVPHEILGRDSLIRRLREDNARLRSEVGQLRANRTAR